MLTPEGQSADKTDKIMLLAMWANTLKKETATTSLPGLKKKAVISAGMGKPTFPINEYTIQMYLAYWKEIERLARVAIDSTDEDREKAVIGYGAPQGDDDARTTMAIAMSEWYETPVKANNVLFTVGGAGALRVIFETFNLLYQDIPKYRVITPFPHYTLYADNRHRLHPIDVMKEPGYQLTARSIRESIISANTLAEKDMGYPKAILICNPSNPLGTIISEAELRRIAVVLREYPDLHIVLDEAYAEMCFETQKVPSLLLIAPDLKHRLIMMRSATKALSAAGERMAVLMAFDEQLMAKFLDKNISFIGHAPRSSQIAYAETMAHFSEEKHQQLVGFYRTKTSYVAERLRAMGASMPDPDYKVEGSFYILADFSDLLGLELPANAARALEKTGPVTTNEELAYYLLFNDSVMIAPASYFGLSKENGYMRITCSGTESELCELMDRLESRMIGARRIKKIKLLDDIAKNLPTLHEKNKVKHDEVMMELTNLLEQEETSLSLKRLNIRLKEMHLSINVSINQANELGPKIAAITIQSFFRGKFKRKHKDILSDEIDKEWQLFVDQIVSESSELKVIFLSLSRSVRSTLLPWREHLKNKYPEIETRANSRSVF